MNPRTLFSKNEAHYSQSNRVRAKCSDEVEFSFWHTFADSGLLPFEKQAIEAMAKARSTLLDIGCGCGREAAALTNMGFAVTAIDVTPRMALATKLRAGRAGATVPVACADIVRGIPFEGPFDNVLMLEQVYQHIPAQVDRQNALKNVRALIAPGGLLFLSVFNEGDIDLGARLAWMRETAWYLPK